MNLGLGLLVGTKLVEGGFKFISSMNQAKLVQQEGLLEQLDAEREASLTLDEGYRLRQKQAMDYIGGGVELQGTPLLVLAETARRTDLMAQSIRDMGQRKKWLADQNARAITNEGRSALISSIMSSIGTYSLGSTK